MAREAQALMEDAGYRKKARDVADLMQDQRHGSDPQMAFLRSRLVALVALGLGGFAAWMVPQPGTSCDQECTWFAPLGVFAAAISLVAVAAAVTALAPATREKQAGQLLLLGALAGAVLWVLTALMLLWIFKAG